MTLDERTINDWLRRLNAALNYTDEADQDMGLASLHGIAILIEPIRDALQAAEANQIRQAIQTRKDK